MFYFIQKTQLRIRAWRHDFDRAVIFFNFSVLVNNLGIYAARSIAAYDAKQRKIWKPNIHLMISNTVVYKFATKNCCLQKICSSKSMQIIIYAIFIDILGLVLQKPVEQNLTCLKDNSETCYINCWNCEALKKCDPQYAHIARYFNHIKLLKCTSCNISCFAYFLVRLSGNRDAESLPVSWTTRDSFKTYTV